MALTSDPDGAEPLEGAVEDADAQPEPVARAKSLTIGAVCKALSQEVPDISISKIRYLEDQKLLAPRRTPGGYRLYSGNDVSRLRTILRLQRDEFLPLRVIRQELASGREADEGGPPGEPEQRGRRISLDRTAESVHTLDEMVDETGVDERLVRELEEHGLVRGDGRRGERTYDGIERDIVRAVIELTRYGVAPRNLRVFRTSADREASLLEQLLGHLERCRL